MVSEVAQSCPTLCDPMDGSLPGSAVHGIFQARILEWAAISFSRGSSQSRDRTRVSCIADRCFTVWATREAPKWWSCKEKLLLYFLCVHVKSLAISLHLTSPALAAGSLPPVPHGKPSHISHGKVKCVISMEVNLAVAINTINMRIFWPSNSTFGNFGLQIYLYKYNRSMFMVFVVVLFAVGKDLKQHRCLCKRLWLVHMVEYYTTVKRKEENALYCEGILWSSARISEDLRIVVTCVCVWRCGEAGLW